MQSICFVVIFAAVVFAGVCEDRMANAPKLMNTFENFQARCLACQGGKTKTSADVRADPCEYCGGDCHSAALFEGNPILCIYKKRELGKRASCDGKNVAGGTHAFVTPKTAPSASTLRDIDTRFEDMTISHSEPATFGDDTTTVDPNYVPPTTGNGNVITPPKGGTTAKTSTTTGKAGSVCAKGPPVKYLDRCGVCGGTGACSAASSLQLSVMLVSALVAYVAL